MITDFGLAVTVESEHPDTTAESSDRHIVGTPRYMSPEQVAGGPVGTGQ